MHKVLPSPAAVGVENCVLEQAAQVGGLPLAKPHCCDVGL
jgi:hypothetical protein